MRFCAICGAPTKDRRRPTCSLRCGAKYREHPPDKVSKDAARRRVLRRRGKATECEQCSSTHNVQWHHPNIRQRPDDVIALCRDCHEAADKAIDARRSATPSVTHHVNGTHPDAIDASALRLEHGADYMPVFVMLLREAIAGCRPVHVVSDGEDANVNAVLSVYDADER